MVLRYKHIQKVQKPSVPYGYSLFFRNLYPPISKLTLKIPISHFPEANGAVGLTLQTGFTVGRKEKA